MTPAAVNEARPCLALRARPGIGRAGIRNQPPTDVVRSGGLSGPAFAREVIDPRPPVPQGAVSPAFWPGVERTGTRLMEFSTGRVQGWWPRFAVFCLIALFACAVVLAAAPPAYAQAEGEAAAETGAGDSLFWHFVKSLGWFFLILFLAISIGLVALIALLAMDLR